MAKRISKDNEAAVKEIDKSVSNKFRWDWLDKTAKLTIKTSKGSEEVTEKIGDFIAKIDVPGKAQCLYCNETITYGSRGRCSFTEHSSKKKHLEIVALRRANYSLGSAFKVTPGIDNNARLLDSITESEPLTPLSDRKVHSEVELLDKARKKNIIVCLGTGTGKTFIAVMLIKELAHEIRKPFDENGKRTFFLVNNVPLVTQQARVIREHTDLTVGEFQGNMNVDIWKKEEWITQYENNHVMVLTSQIFLDILNHGFLSLAKCNLIILDECHHAIKRHPMREVMRHFDQYTSESRPRILGLTASVIQKYVRPGRLIDTINDLERTMRCSAETTSDLVNISLYGTDAQEFIVEFKDFDTKKYKSLVSILHEVSKFLTDYYYDKCNDDDSVDETRYPRNFVTEMLFTFQTMGLWCSLWLCRMFIGELENMIADVPFQCYKLLLQLSSTRLRLFQQILNAEVKDDGSYDSLIAYSSPKLIRLLEILKSGITESEKLVLSHSLEQSKYEFCAVVFVQRRHTAYILNKFLREVAKRNPEFNKMKSCYITGHGVVKTTSVEESRMSHNVQEEVLNNFRQHNTNVMIATSVVEEGLDLPRCNLVVRFDRPLQYRSYIQSKGRARQKVSKYVLLIEEKEMSTFTKQLDEFHEIERILLHQCKDNAVPTDEEIAKSFSDELYPPYKPEKGEGKPQITITSSIAVVNRYCAKLPSDTFTRLTPRCKMKKIKIEDVDMYKCTLFLPINSPVKQQIEYCEQHDPALRDKIEEFSSDADKNKIEKLVTELAHSTIHDTLHIGEAANSAKLAKMVVALKTCEILHKAGELDDNLLPLSKDALKMEEENQSEDEIDDDDDGILTGTTKRRRNYYKQVAECLKDSFPVHSEKSYVYVITTELVCPIPEEQNTRGRPLYDPATSSRCFAILTKKPIPKICGFPVFTRSGEVSINICEVFNNPHLTADQLEKLSYFHHFTFSDVLRLKKAPMEFQTTGAKSSYLIIPVQYQGNDNCYIDWDFVQTIYKQKEDEYYRKKVTPTETFKFDENLFKDAVVTPSYRNQDQPHLFYVAEILTNLNPLSEFPGLEFKTFQHYYKEKYDFEIKCLHQPLLDVDHTSARLNLLTPRYVNRKGVALPTSSDETKLAKRLNLNNKQILVPELCHIHPFPISLWKKAVCLPSILYRVNSLLLSEQLRILVAVELAIGDVTQDQEWPPLDFGWSLADAFKESEGNHVVQQDDEISGNPTISEEKSCQDVYAKVESNETDVVDCITKAERSEVDSEILVDGINESENNCAVQQDDTNQEVKKENEISGHLTISEAKSCQDVHAQVESNGTDVVDWILTGAERNGVNSDILVDGLNDSPSHLSQPKLFTVSDDQKNFTNDASIQNLNIEEAENDEFMENYDDEFELLNMQNLEVLPNQFSMLNLTATSVSCSDNGGNFCDEDYSDKSNKVIGKTLNESNAVEEKSSVIYCENEFNCNAEQNVSGISTANQFSFSKVGNTLSQSSFNDCDADLSFKLDSTSTNSNSAQPVDAPQKTEMELSEEIKFSKTITINGANEMLPKKSLLPVSNFLGDDEKEDLEPSIYQCLDNIDKNNSSNTPNNFSISQINTLECKTVHDANASTSEVNATTVVQFGDLIPDHDEKKSLVVISANSFSFDQQVDLKTHRGPSPSIILQALTMSNANDGINLERLETIGDSFLKYAVSVYLYCKHPNVHEGKLSYLRSRQVSNMNLYKLGKRKQLGQLMISAKFEPSDNWLPPCYSIPPKISRYTESVSNQHENISNLNECDDEISPKIKDIEKNPDVPFDLHTEHSIPDKSIADCVEALIGAYLITCGTKGALIFMSWLGFKVSPKLGIETKEENDKSWLELPPSPLTEFVPDAEKQMMHLLSGHEDFETVLDYQFKDKAYLLQALTHASYHYNRLTDCYQRLEFLGDAILDYLITRHLYEDPRQHSPGALTDLRSALVNNTFFASLAVKYQFFKFFKSISPGLFQVITQFVDLKRAENENEMEKFYLNEIDCDSNEAEEIEVPKALGDIFESVAGAIFLDSGMSLDTVWSVYYPMMKPEIEHFSSNVPKSPIRELLEMEPETAKFGKPQRTIRGKIRVEVDVYGKGKFVGVGRNYRIAKCTAAKRALKYLRKQL
ncbi:Endoribonuclease Dicer [Nymphon striatum]|nr:Endoribonuclease Dicer [Nymphon striatum]